MPKEAQPPAGILDFWAPPKAAPQRVRRVEIHPVSFEGRVFSLVLDAPNQVEAAAVLGRLLEQLLAEKSCETRFQRQSISLSQPTTPCDKLVLGPVTIYASASTTHLPTLRRMTLDRLAYALSDCRAVPGVTAKYDAINLQIVRKT